MIYLTYKNGEVKEITIGQFESSKDTIPTDELIQIEGKFTELQCLAFGVRPFLNKIAEAK